jgi:glycosyltransferase involved in cell wall biosynthesis
MEDIHEFHISLLSHVDKIVFKGLEMISLLILAYNEEKFIKKVVNDYINEFNHIIVLNDCSSDLTLDELSEFNSNQLEIISNFENLGAGKSLELGLQGFIKSENDFLIKIDGDDQFDKKDVLKLKELATNEEFDFISCDRFWEHGISGEIPFIRYLGNAFASLLIKISTGNWKINDPLNGLMLFSKKAAKQIELPKKFHRYGYPFFVNTEVSKLQNNSKLIVGQMNNTVTYIDNRKTISAISMFFKLITFTFNSYLKKISSKIKISGLQGSSFYDLLFISCCLLSLFSFLKIISIRYFSYIGSQTNWLIILILLVLCSIMTFYLSQNIESKYKNRFFKIIS